MIKKLKNIWLSRFSNKCSIDFKALSGLRLSSRTIIFAIFLLGLFLRLFGLYNIELAGDFKYHWSVAREIVVDGKIPMLGPSASVNESFHLGPFYYYLLSIPYAFGYGDFRVAIIFFSVINSFSIIILYKALKHWFSEKFSLKVAALYSFSAYMITVQNFPWNPYILPTLITIILYCIAQIRSSKNIWILVLGFVFGLSIQAHATAIFLLPSILLLLPLNKLNLKYAIFGLLGFLISISPWLYYDITADFSQTREALKIFAPVNDNECSFSEYLKNHGNGERCFSQIRNSLFIVRFFTMSLFNTRSLVAVLLLSVLSALFFFKSRLKQRNFVLIWVLIPWILYLFYSSNVYLHYFLIFFPMPFVVFVMMMEVFSKRSKKSKKISVIIYSLILLLNIFVHFYGLRLVRG